MNRLQKKCVIASTGFHLLLALILFVGPGFQSPEKKPENHDTVMFVPSKFLDAEIQGGGNPNAKPPPAAPVQPVARPPAPTPPEPKPEKAPEKEPPKDPPRELKSIKPDPDSLETHTEKKHKIEVNLKPVNRDKDKDTKKAQKQPSESDTRAQEAKELADRRRQLLSQLRQSADNIRAGTSSATAIEEIGPGGGGPAYANYAAWVKTKYENAWTPPDDAASDDAIAKVSVTIASDGTVMSARIIKSSGDSQVDRSVQRTLDRVTFIAPFPEGAKEKQRSYVINFNLKAKRGLG
jgi:TonB family protein